MEVTPPHCVSILVCGNDRAHEIASYCCLPFTLSLNHGWHIDMCFPVKGEKLCSETTQSVFLVHTCAWIVQIVWRSAVETKLFRHIYFNLNLQSDFGFNYVTAVTMILSLLQIFVIYMHMWTNPVRKSVIFIHNQVIYIRINTLNDKTGKSCLMAAVRQRHFIKARQCVQINKQRQSWERVWRWIKGDKETNN